MVGLIAWIVTAVLVAEWFWGLVGAAAVTLAAWALRRSYRNANAELDVIEAEKQAIIRRCDQQHQWVLQGNERGVWGEGTAAMRDYRRGAMSTDQPIPSVIRAHPSTGGTILRA